MQKAPLIATTLGATALLFGAAHAGPMSGGMGMPAPPPSAPLSGTTMDRANTQADTCGDNDATRIPCAHHDTKAKATTKGKAAAAADQSGANASASTGAAATTPAATGAAGASTTSTATTGDSPH